MISLIIGLSRLPHLPKHSQPAVGDAAIGVTVGATVRANLLPVGIGPGGLRKRALGPLLGNGTEIMVTGATELDQAPFTALLGDRASTGQALNAARGRKPLTVLTKEAEQRWSQKVSSPGQGSKDVRIIQG